MSELKIDFKNATTANASKRKAAQNSTAASS